MRVNSKPALMIILVSVCSLVVADEVQVPSLEFLDYLGDLVKHDGEWIDPLDMDSDLMADDEAKVAALVPAKEEAEKVE